MFSEAATIKNKLFYKKDVLRNFTKFTGNFKEHFFTEHLWTTSSVFCRILFRGSQYVFSGSINPSDGINLSINPEKFRKHLVY